MLRERPTAEATMSKPKIRHGDWVVVCDGKKALVLENVGDEWLLDLKTREVFEHVGHKTCELGTDAPGRAFNSVGSTRSAMEQTDWHDQEEQRFLHRLSSHLDAAVIAGKAKSLIVVAPPRALGVLRNAFSSHVVGAVRGEIDKDFVKMPVHEIEKHLTA
jgi:protein required for attachment to host cells